MAINGRNWSEEMMRDVRDWLERMVSIGKQRYKKSEDSPWDATFSFQKAVIENEMGRWKKNGRFKKKFRSGD
jgi:hypothetical protein